MPHHGLNLIALLIIILSRVTDANCDDFHQASLDYIHHRATLERRNEACMRSGPGCIHQILDRTGFCTGYIHRISGHLNRRNSHTHGDCSLAPMLLR